MASRRAMFSQAADSARALKAIFLPNESLALKWEMDWIVCEVPLGDC